MRREQLILAGVSVASLVAGAAGGYFIAWKRLEKAYDELVRQQVAEAKKFYAVAQQEAEEKPASPIDALNTSKVEEAAAALIKYQGGKVIEDAAKAVAEAVSDSPLPPASKIHNIFAKVAAKDTGPERRDPAMPYAITEEEFENSELSYEQVSYTYYAGDDTLADEVDQPVDDTTRRQLVGNHNLALFGDEEVNQIWVRNELQSFDFEISRSTGDYAKEVAGFR